MGEGGGYSCWRQLPILPCDSTLMAPSMLAHIIWLPGGASPQSLGSGPSTLAHNQSVMVLRIATTPDPPHCGDKGPLDAPGASALYFPVPDPHRLPHPEATSIRHLPRPGPEAAVVEAEALLAWASLLHRALGIGQTDFLLELKLPRPLHTEMNCRIPCLADTGGLRSGKYHIC